MATEIAASVCKACGTISYPQRKCCKSCGKTEFEKVPLEGTATLLTFTRVYNLSLAFEERYITLGIVEFGNGARALGRLAVDDPRTGMKLSAYVAPVRTESYKTFDGLWFK
jgi:uncharacterized OB-fold protein